MSDTLIIALLLLVAVLGFASKEALKSLASNAAKGIVDQQVGKVLAEHKHGLDIELEQHRALQSAQLEALRRDLSFGSERYARDYGLFAAKRNEVYAELYSLLEKAVGTYAPRFMIMRIGNDFSKATREDLTEFVNKIEHVTAGQRANLSHLIDSGNLAKAREAAAELDEGAHRPRAEAAFTEVRNGWILQSLYLSDEVNSLIQLTVQDLAEMSAILFTEDAEPKRDWKKRADLLAATRVSVANVRNKMRSEMTAGFSIPQQAGPVPLVKVPATQETRPDSRE